MLIFLIGPPGAGKSRLAPLLAAALGVPAHDLDRSIEAASGRTIEALFIEHGEAGFRELEHKALVELSEHESGVVATGGGVVLDPRSRRLLRSFGPVVFLATTPQTQLERLSASGGLALRPLLAGEPDPLARLEALYAERLPWYRIAAHHELNTDGIAPQATVTAVLALLAATASPPR